MLPSRLFKNTGVPHRLRSLLTLSPSLPPNIAVQLRLRLGVIRPNSSLASPPPAPAQSSSNASSTPNSLEAPASTDSGATTTTNKIQLEQPEPRLSITFTCTVPDCGTRSSHQFSKRSYTSGIVLVECPGCKNRHLIADHLGWFKDSMNDGKMRTVEDIMREKGESVRRGALTAGGDIEYAPDP
ncbi:zf-DNL-domain-containing protein [Peniophora sp. CONT]|nr:zf-DNL-domain-containing protein [Peniophora sp. CONT]